MSGVGPQGEEPSEQDWPVREPGRPALQVVLLAGLVALFGLVSALPPERHREVLTWVAAQDGDFAGRWAGARAWVAGAGDAVGERVAGMMEQVAGMKERLPTLPERPAWLGVLGGAQPGPAPGGAPGAPAKSPTPAPGGSGAPGAAQPAPAPTGPPPQTPAAPATLMPVPGKLLYDYGWLPQGQEPHGGLDFAAAVGEPVLAIADGTVLRVAADPALGGLVEVDHGFIIALYGQVGNSQVKAGDRVTQGQTLATIAAPTGKEGDREPHLHLEARVTTGAKPVDPAPFLPMSAAPQGGTGN